MLTRIRRLTTEVLLVAILSTGTVALLLARLPACLGPGCEARAWTARFADYLVGVLTPWTIVSGPSGRAVSEILLAASISVSIIALTTILLLGLSLPLGIGSALRPESTGLSFLRGSLLGLSSVPVLVWAVILVLAIPFSPVPESLSDPRELGKILLPVLALCLGDSLLADFTRRIRLETARLIQEPHIRTVKAWGLSFRRHVALGLIPPVLELLVSRAAFLVGTTIVVERVFQWPGLGYRVIEELAQRDGESEIMLLLISITLVGITVGVRLIRSILTMAADPRVAGDEHV